MLSPEQQRWVNIFMNLQKHRGLRSSLMTFQFALKLSPVETVEHQVTLAVYQLDRDLLVERLTKGLPLAKKTFQKNSTIW